ncbi:MOSC domain-containing protein [Maritimibacter fusiformis]|uniref:MOSC domain-containing protein n=1 Tax=Maritimibacter fusiformis TaxID=2603819 RepID=A0A5D0RNH6_9RHOB|nr:MOSC domain-containing protein [Maritimibacter fusiformis]TYB82405.1 MOSC domain-containing protein [Maritimibacter fusiformis]
MQEVSGRVARLQIGTPRPLGPDGVMSSFRRQPVPGPVMLKATGFEGDRVGDTRHHGGVEKAAHAYPLAHYAAWRGDLPDMAAAFTEGSFGENLTVEGLTEADICIGDSFTLGAARVQVSQARQPCSRLNLRFERRDMARLVQDSGRTGWYFRVLDPGAVRLGDALRLVARPNPDWPLDRVWRLLYRSGADDTALVAFAALEGLSPSWRALAEKRLARREVEDWTARLGG